MKGFFDDMLAAIFVLAVLAASYIFLFMGTVQSGTMMGNALQHRIRIEQLQSAAQAFRYISEPNTGESLSYLVGVAAITGDSRVWVEGQAVDSLAASRGALDQLLGSNYQLSVELPSRQVDIVFVVPQSPTLVEEKDALLAAVPGIRRALEERMLNATLSSVFLSYASCGYEWCDNATLEVIDCTQTYLPPSRGVSNYNLGVAIAQASQVPGLGLKVVIPLSDSLSTGDAPDSCFNACSTGPRCEWCSTACASTRSDASLRSAALYSKENQAAVCPLSFPRCSSLGEESLAHFSCTDASFVVGSCSSCAGCEARLGEVCFPSCGPELERQFQDLAQATGCEASRIIVSQIRDAVLSHVDAAVSGNKFRVGSDPPKDRTLYSEDIVLPVTPPLKARLTVW